MRNAESRKDGYWPFVGRKEEPPLVYTYGEFPLPFFTRAVDIACAHAGLGPGQGTFCDLGSGAGRLVLWAAATREWQEVRGVEYLPSLHSAACAKLGEAQTMPGLLMTPPNRIVLREGSWDDPNLFHWSEIDVAFAYSTAFPADENEVLVELSRSLTPRLRAGCIVCTTDYKLADDGFELLEELIDANEGVGGDSVAYIYRKTSAGMSDTAVMGNKVEAQDRRVAELERLLASRDAEMAVLSQRTAALEQENQQLRQERDMLQAELGESERNMLSALRDWADETKYFKNGDGAGS